MLSDGRHDRFPLLFIFFLSGASGLVFQVVWSRGLTLVFGSTTHAVSTVLAAFMGGLALGSLIVGRRGDRIARPLIVYAWIEAGIAVLAVGVLAALPALEPIYRLAWREAGASPAVLNGLRFALACLVLLPPTALMGATLPILSAHVERSARGVAGRVRGTGAGALYAANTIGAVAGAAAGGFLLLPALGMIRSALVGALANLAAAAAAWALARRAEPARPEEIAADCESAPVDAPAIDGPDGAADGVALPVLLTVAACSGAGALILEVAWTRILSLVLGSSTHAFTIMLTTFLAGLAAGGAAATRRLPRIARPLLALAIVEAGAGLAALAGVRLFPELPYAFLALFRWAGGGGLAFETGRFLIAALVMLPATFLLGAAFPLAARAALAGRARVAEPVAALYAANTAGAILGACAAGFLLIPVLGLQGTLLVASFTLTAGAVLLPASRRGARPFVRAALAGLLLLPACGLTASLPEWNRAVMASGVFQYAPDYARQFVSRRGFLDAHARQTLLFYEDGPTTTVAVERRPDRIDGKVNTILSVNGKVDASSAGDMDTQVLLAQLPLLVAPRPGSVLVIGLGSGVTAGSALSHPIEELRVVEIEPAILRAQWFFEDVNRKPLDDPRTHVSVDDARNVLLVSDRRYDIIISEPSNPWISGPSKLFTTEFFELAKSRLADDGLLCQWVQMYGLDTGSLAALLRTYADVFPHRMVFRGSSGDLLLLGASLPIRLDPERIARKMQIPDIRDDLARVRVHEPADLLARFRLGDTGVEQFAGAGPLNTDDNALIEFAAARTLYLQDHLANQKALDAIPESPALYLAPSDPETAARLAARLAERLLDADVPEKAASMLDAARALAGVPEPARAELAALDGDLRRAAGDAEGAARAWESALAIEPSNPRGRLGLASLRVQAGDPRAAERLLEPAGGDPFCAIELARLRLAAGDPDGAFAAIRRIEAADRCAGSEADHDPGTGPLLHLYTGRALVAMGRHYEAVRHLKLYFELHPRVPRPAERSLEAAVDLATSHLALGDVPAAVERFRMAAGLADSLSAWSRKEATQAVRSGDTAGAARLLRAALMWKPGDETTLRLLGAALNDLGRREEAIEVWSDLNRLREGDPEALRNLVGLSLAAGRVADALLALRELRQVEPDPVRMLEIDHAIREMEARVKAGGTEEAPPPA